MKENKDFILSLYRTKSSVFTIAEIGLLIGESNKDNLKAKINYYVKKGKLRNVRKGIYTKDEYNPLELGAKIYTPSYISLETILQREGVIFQEYTTIFLVSYLSRKVEVDGWKFQYRRIKENILVNSLGVKQEENYYMASKERAFLDALYLYKDYYFDNIESLDKGKVLSMLEIYHSKALEKRAMERFKNV
jgi:hypothetical protein